MLNYLSEGMDELARARGAARDRVVDVAVELFARHGVQGTSLRMIADRIGVGKAAVYYQFRSKDEIVLAVLQPVFDDVAGLITTIDSLPCPGTRRDAAISGLVDLAINHRQASLTFRRDPVIDRLIAFHDEFRAIADRFHALLLGPDPGDVTRVSLAVAIAGLYCCATDSALSDVAAADLSAALLSCFKQCVAQD